MENLTQTQKAQRDLFCAAALTGILSRGGKHDPNDDAMEAFEAAEALMAYIAGVDECSQMASDEDA
jgi:hypothetical protein